MELLPTNVFEHSEKTNLPTAYLLQDSKTNQPKTYLCPMRFTLGKDTKLKSKKAIEQLFTNGNSIRKGPVRCVYNVNTGTEQPHKIGVSVSKRFFKKAPDRNRIKRLLREAYRLNQHSLYLPQGKHLEMMFLFQSPKMPDFDFIEKLMKRLISEINKSHQEHSN